jgi:hypothetical protein
MNLCSSARQLFLHFRRHENDLFFKQGNVEKVVVVIKDKDEVALERFIFSIQTMIAIESFNKDTRSTSSGCLCHPST